MSSLSQVCSQILRSWSQCWREIKSWYLKKSVRWCAGPGSKRWGDTQDGRPSGRKVSTIINIRRGTDSKLHGIFYIQMNLFNFHQAGAGESFIWAWTAESSSGGIRELSEKRSGKSVSVPHNWAKILFVRNCKPEASFFRVIYFCLMSTWNQNWPSLLPGLVGKIKLNHSQ